MRSELMKSRLDKMLNSDKEEINEATRDAAVAEFSRVAREYFETNGDIAFDLKRGKNGLDISVDFHAARVKNFTVLK